MSSRSPASSSAVAAPGAEPVRGASLHELFERQAARAPDAVAASLDGETLSYAELDARANRLARHLRAAGIGPDTLVAIRVERSFEMLVGMLGILKAGGAYLPIDVVYPKERVAFMLEDSGARLIATTRDLAADLDGLPGTRVLLDALPDAPSDPIAADVDADRLAYVIYTSGSTGKPKGVQITHRNVTRLFAATDRWFGFDETDVWTLFHSFAFDFSVWEMWGALIHGGRIVVVPYFVSRSPDAFRELLRRERVTVLNQTPSAFRQLMQADLAQAPADYALRYVIFGGEALELQGLRPWFARYGDATPRLINMYGITETTVHVTYRPVGLRDLDAGCGSVIGEPIPDLQLHVLDDQGRPAPVGVVGEMYVGGAGVARGYLNRPELTAQRFVRDPFSDDPAARLYRTGDLACRLENGDVEYKGRIDHQVKIRGFRIELGEIESVLAQHDRVAQVSVMAREDRPGDVRLVAYVVPRGAMPPPAEFREALSRHLPDYMVPQHFVRLDALPLNHNGKVDRDVLPPPDASNSAVAATVADARPLTDAERRVAGVWAELLGTTDIRPEDNFFDLGGHSLLATRAIERIEALTGARIRVQQFTFETLAQIAASTESASAAAAAGGSRPAVRPGLIARLFGRSGR